jgi:hypothetical protein
MFSLRTQSETILQGLTAILLFATTAAAQIPGLCNTGLSPKTVLLGCNSGLVTPNPLGGGPNRDGNWVLAYPYPSALSATTGPCTLKSFTRAWVDTPNIGWMPNDGSPASEWVTPYDGEGSLPAGWYVYRTAFPVPSVLSNGALPTLMTINGQLASDNTTYAIYLENPAHSGNCSLVSGQPFPVNPRGIGTGDFEQWWPFSFTNASAIAPGTEAYLYFVVENSFEHQDPGPSSPTGLRVEFFSSSTFN